MSVFQFNQQHAKKASFPPIANFIKPPIKFEPLPGSGHVRRKLWDMNTNLHCSLIGTCLTTGELRRIVVKIAGASAQKLSDHEIHQEGVLLASRRDGAAKLLQKALDTRHAAALRKFASAHTAAEVLALWKEARAEGDIPGAYWAALTHPDTDITTMRQIFGDVHMLSHLVGSANRADIRRLAELEDEVTALTEKVIRQEGRLRAVALERDEKARALDALMTERLLDRKSEHKSADAISEFNDFALRLQAKLERESARLAALESEQKAWRQERQKMSAEFERMRKSEASLLDELHSVENMMQRQQQGETASRSSKVDFSGFRLLYVGGRTHFIPSLQASVEALGADFIHHDGGEANALGLLPGLVSQANVVVFPLDCVSHSAATTVKKLCKQADKAYVPLARSGLGSLLRALEELPPLQMPRF